MVIKKLTHTTYYLQSSRKSIRIQLDRLPDKLSSLDQLTKKAVRRRIQAFFIIGKNIMDLPFQLMFNSRCHNNSSNNKHRYSINLIHVGGHLHVAKKKVGRVGSLCKPSVFV